MSNDLTTILVKCDGSPGYILNLREIEDGHITNFIRSPLFSKVTGWVLEDRDDPRDFFHWRKSFDSERDAWRAAATKVLKDGGSIPKMFIVRTCGSPATEQNSIRSIVR